MDYRAGRVEYSLLLFLLVIAGESDKLLVGLLPLASRHIGDRQGGLQTGQSVKGWGFSEKLDGFRIGNPDGKEEKKGRKKEERGERNRKDSGKTGGHHPPKTGQSRRKC